MSIDRHLELLGLKVKDRITGTEGIVTSVAFDLYGCIQAVIHPGLDKDGKLMESYWFDIGRLKILSNKHIMDVPDFNDSTRIAQGKKGPAEKPVLK